MRDEAIVEALKRTSLPQCQTNLGTDLPVPRRRRLPPRGRAGLSPGLRFGPPRAHPNQRTCAFFVRRPDRTPPPQDLQLEAPPQHALAGNPVIAAHLRLRASRS